MPLNAALSWILLALYCCYNTGLCVVGAAVVTAAMVYYRYGIICISTCICVCALVVLLPFAEKMLFNLLE